MTLAVSAVAVVTISELWGGGTHLGTKLLLAHLITQLPLALYDSPAEQLTSVNKFSDTSHFVSSKNSVAH